MVITRINFVNKTNSNQISFKAGKVDFYSDFDHTYFPGQQSAMKNTSPESHPGLVKYFDDFKKFLNNTRDGLKFHITSGRTFGEFETIAWQIKESGFKMTLPDTFIAKNGSDEHIRVCTDEDFYKNGKFPFKYDVTNKEKENEIKAATNWDGPKIKAKLKELLKEHDFRIIEHDSENSVSDYGYKSLFYHIGKDDFQLKNDGMPPQGAWIAGLRNDGNLKIYMSYPYDMDFVPERLEVSKDIRTKVDNFIDEMGAKVTIVSNDCDRNCGNRPTVVFTPRMDESYRYASMSKEDDLTLTKLYDTKQAVKRAIKNNDLVIVAGDSSNDFNMLNPAMYIDLPENIHPKIAMHKTSPENFLKWLQLDPIKDAETIKRCNINLESHAKIIKQIEDLPFIGIVVKNEDKGNPLSEIVKAYGKGKYPKIIEVDPLHLEDGVRQAIKMYAEKNPEYAKKLSHDLKKEVLGIVEELKKNDKVIEVVKKNSKRKIFAFASVITGFVCGIGVYLKKRKDEQTQKINSTATIRSNWQCETQKIKLI